MTRLAHLCACLTLIAIGVAAELHGPRPLGPLVNSPGDDIAPAWAPDGTVIYFSSNWHRPGPVSPEVTEQPPAPWPFNLYATQFAGPAHLMLVPQMLAVLTDFRGPTTSSEGDLIYFTSSPTGPETDRFSRLLQARFLEGRVGSPEGVFGLPPGSSVLNPHVSTDGNTLIFAWRAPESEASVGWDLFMSTRVADHWSPPMRLPDPINSQFDETSGRLSADGRILLFDSNRPPRPLPPPPPPGEHEPTVGAVFPPPDDEASPEFRRGDFDIFSALRTPEGQWRFVHRLGRAVNTPFAETGPALSPDGHTLLFASNRPRQEPPPPDPIDEPPPEAMIPVEELGSPEIPPPPGAPRDFDLYAATVPNTLNLNVPTHVQPGAHAVITATWDAAPWGGPYRVDLSFSTPCRLRPGVSDPNPLIFEDDEDRPERRGSAGTAVWVIEVPHTAPPLVHVTVRLHSAYQTLVERQAVIVLPGHSPEVPAESVVSQLTGAADLHATDLGAADANADGLLDAADVVTLNNRGL